MLDKEEIIKETIDALNSANEFKAREAIRNSVKEIIHSQETIACCLRNIACEKEKIKAITVIPIEVEIKL